jgi:hypothetical protein
MRILMPPVSTAGPVMLVNDARGRGTSGAAEAHKQTPLIIDASMAKVAM